MRQLLLCASLVSALVGLGHAAQETPQRFRAGVDLITIDVAAVDAKGKPVEDLKPGDFVVKVDGKPRPAVSAELIKVDRGKPAPRPSELISTNNVPQNARRIILAVDQTLLTPGALVPLQKTASEFVGRLVPDDYAAFVAFPEPGPRVDFTQDKAAVRKGLESIVGQPSRRGGRRFNIALWEAFALTGSERPTASSLPPITAAQDPRQLIESLMQPPTMRRIFERGCEGQSFEELTDVSRNLDELLQIIKQCRMFIYTEAMSIAQEARIDATISLRSLEAVLRDLAQLEGPKTMVLFSAGLVNDDPTLLDESFRLAAAARTTIHVIAVERDRDEELRDMPNGQPKMSLLDRSFELAGLEILADRTNGTLSRPVASGAGIFERLEQELSAWYLVAVERQPGDPDRQRLEVDVRRRGVTVRSNRNAIAVNAAAGKRALDDLLNEVLSSRFAIPGLPLRVSTFAQRDADPSKYRLRLAADIGQPGEPAGEFAIGYVLTDEKGRVLTTAGSRRTLTPVASGGKASLQYDTSLAVAPGSYLLRFGAVDSDGRRGALVRRIELPSLVEGQIQTSDLIVGNLPAEGETLSARVEPQITASEIAGYLELYLPDAVDSNVTVTLEIAEGDASSALASQTLALRPGESPTARVATGFVAAGTMTPGRYVARATVRRGEETVKTLTRPITIVRDATVVSRPVIRARGVPISRKLQELTASYVAGVVNGLANVVAEESFTLSKPDRRVTSDLLLVRYPGSRRDLIPYRDVAQLNGKPIEGRAERLVDLFVTPTDAVRERARQIMSSADAYVPPAFNPMFVLGFLQSDYQSRFELTVNEAGAEWPREVKAVTFVETGRPTLLRIGPFGDVDAPTRGTAWIEEGTGRIHQTELEVGRGRSAPKMTTKFRLDDRLQITVPVEMRTENPDGVATYTNFRRFGVETDTVIPVPPAPQN